MIHILILILNYILRHKETKLQVGKTTPSTLERWSRDAALHLEYSRWYTVASIRHPH
jgi:hypothetical protein